MSGEVVGLIAFGISTGLCIRVVLAWWSQLWYPFIRMMANVF